MVRGGGSSSSDAGGGGALLDTGRVADLLVGGGYLRGDQAHSLLVLASAAHTSDIEVGFGG